MDELLKIAADAGHEVTTAEQALEDEAPDAARDALDRAADRLQELRDRWPQMTKAERNVVGAAASAIRTRHDACAKRLPVRRTLSEGAAVIDPDQERDPEHVPPPAAGA